MKFPIYTGDHVRTTARAHYSRTPLPSSQRYIALDDDDNDDDDEDEEYMVTSDNKKKDE